MPQAPVQTHHVLVADDNDGDLVLIEQALLEVRPDICVHTVRGGEKCIDFLLQRGEHADAPTPALVLLDLSMPRVGGRAVLQAVLENEQTRHLPIVLLSNVGIQREGLELYRLRCSGYVPKAQTYSGLVHALKTVCDYWLEVAAYPPRLLG